MSLPDFGIDPALLAPMGSAAPTAPASPADPLASAIEALLASGANFGPQQPAYEPGGYQSDNLAQPDWSHRVPVQNRPDYNPTASELPDGWDSAVSAQPVHLSDQNVTLTGQQAGSAQGDANAAGQYRRNVLADPNEPVAPGDIEGQYVREQQSLQAVGDAKMAHAMADMAAEKERAERVATAHVDSAAETQKANQDFQVAREAAQVKADADTQAWMMEYTTKAQQEPNPDRWWDNRSGLAKALWAMSLVFGSAYAATTPGAQNVALQMVQDNIQQDIALQKHRLTQELDALKLKGSTVKERNLRNLTDMTDDHTMEMGRLQTLKQAYLARAAAPGQAGMQAGMAGALAFFAEKELGVASRKTGSAVQIEDARLQRDHSSRLQSIAQGHAMRMQNDAQAHDWGKQSREIAKDYDLAQAAAKAAAAKSQGEAMKDVHGVSASLGARMVGSPLSQELGTPDVQVDKLNHPKMSAIFEVANRRYENLRKVAEAMDKGNFVDRMLSGDATLRAAATELGYTTAKELDPQGRLSDQDVIFGSAVSLGYNPTDGKLDVIRFAQNHDGIRKMLDQQMRDMPGRVSKQASTYLNSNLVGKDARIAWAPQDLTVEKPVDPNASEAYGLSSPTAPKDVADFRAKRNAEDADPRFRGRHLPEYDQGAVEKFKTATQGMSPSEVKAAAKKAIKDYADSWSGTPKGDEVTTRLAIHAEAEIVSKVAEKAVKALQTSAERLGSSRGFGDKARPTLADVTEAANRGDRPITQGADEIEKALKVAQEAYDKARALKSKNHENFRPRLPR